MSLLKDIKKGNTAVILIEYQNDFTTKGGKLFEAVEPCLKHTKMLDNTVELVKLARSKGVSVIHLPIEFNDKYSEVNGKYGILNGIKTGRTFTKGQWGSEIYEPLKPVKDEIIIDGKKGLCGFASTNLDFILRQNKYENVILCGFLTNCCVESTMRTAYEKGYNVITVKDCAAATSVEAHEMTLKNNFVLFSEIVGVKDVTDVIGKF